MVYYTIVLCTILVNQINFAYQVEIMVFVFTCVKYPPIAAHCPWIHNPDVLKVYSSGACEENKKCSVALPAGNVMTEGVFEGRDQWLEHTGSGC